MFALVKRLSITALMTLLATLLFAGSARAAGSARLKNNEVTENGGAWRIHVTVELPKAPSLAHVPMKFIFSKTMVYERAQIDGSKDPVINRVALKNQPPQIESMEVSFTNAMGKIWKGTSFDFSLPRDRGYEAGEYELQLRTSDGTEIGGKMRVILKGDNPVVDRRSITFDAKKKGIEKVNDGETGKPKKEENDSKFEMQSQEVTPVGTAAPFVSKDAYEKTPEETIKERPKGCGCDVPGGASVPGLLQSAGAVLALFAFARRRRGRAE